MPTATPAGLKESVHPAVPRRRRNMPAGKRASRPRVVLASPEGFQLDSWCMKSISASQDDNPDKLARRRHALAVMLHACIQHLRLSPSVTQTYTIRTGLMLLHISNALIYSIYPGYRPAPSKLSCRPLGAAPLPSNLPPSALPLPFLSAKRTLLYTYPSHQLSHTILTFLPYSFRAPSPPETPPLPFAWASAPLPLPRPRPQPCRGHRKRRGSFHCSRRVSRPGTASHIPSHSIASRAIRACQARCTARIASHRIVSYSARRV